MSCPTTEKMDYLFQCYNSIHELIRFSDTKAGLIITADGVLISLAVARADELLRAVGSPSRPELLLLLALFLASATLSLFACLWSVAPSLKPVPSVRFTYFGSISKMKLDDYLRELKAATRDDLEHDLAVDIYNISVLAMNKYKKVKFGIWSFTVSVILMMVFLFLILF
jgi:hypothetical protein